MRAKGYSNDIKAPNDDCLQLDSLNSVAIPPPLLSVLVPLRKEKFGGADSMRVLPYLDY